MSFPETQIKGAILVGSSVAGAASMTPLPPGPDGQVLTTDSTTPTGLKWAPGGAGSDIFAATRVVSLVPGDGTDLTIAAAIAALPAEGGLIFVKQGTYPIAATLALTDKPIEIVGAGDGTILDLGALGTPAFTAAFARKYVIRDLRVIGSVANVNRRVITISAAATVSLSRVTGANIRTVFEVTGGAAAILESDNCNILLLNDLASWFVLANASTSIHAENVSITGAANAGGISGGPVAEIFGSTLSAVNGITTGDGSVFSGSEFQGSAGETVSLGNLTKVAGCRFLSLFIAVSGNENKFTGCLFHGSFAQTRCMDVTSTITGPAIVGCSFFGCTTDQLRIGAIDTVVQGCVFFDNGALVRGIDVLLLGFRTIIEGNNFQFMDEAIQMGSSNCIVTGNVGCKVVETGGANVNVYGDNTGFNPATIIGASSRIENYQTLNVGVDFLLTEFQRTLEVDASGGPRTITLPTALSARWRKYTIKKIDASANTVTIDAAGAETIDGALTFVLGAQYQTITIQSNGASWDIIAQGSSALDIFAATRVVSQVAGQGTDLTIQDAINNLPAAGGKIFVKQGTYAIAATLLLPDKPVVIEGAGDGTIISLGANAIPAFTIPDGLTARRDYYFLNLLVTGTSIANQKVWSIEDTNQFGRVHATRVNSSGVQFPIHITAGGSSEPVYAIFDDCHFVPIAAGTSILVNTPALAGVTANIYMNNVRFYDVLEDAITGALTAGGFFADFTGINIIGQGCAFAVGTGGTMGALNLTGSVIENWGPNANPVIALADDNFGRIGSELVGCAVTFVDFNFAGNGCHVYGGFLDASAFTDGAISFFTDCYFFGGINTAAVITGSGDTFIKGCYFDFAGTDFVLDGNFKTIVGNHFQHSGSGLTAIIRTTNGSAEIADNRFNNTIAVAILEAGAVSTNNIDNNRWITNPTLLDESDAIVNGFKRKNVDGGATVDAYVDVFVHENAKGLIGAGAIKNTGANSLTVRRTATDGFGTTDNQEDVVLAGATLAWPMDAPIGTAVGAFVDFTVAVKSTVPGSPTTYDLRHASTGAY